MSEESWADRAASMDFFHIVRLLQRLHPDRAAVATSEDPSKEAVRFRSDTSFAFPTGDVREVIEGENDDPDTVVVNFMGVATPASFGSLPVPYTRELNRRVSRKDPVLRDFLDLFNHRLISLYYRAWERSHIELLRERKADSPFDTVLRCALGLQGPALAENFPVPERGLFSVAGLLAMRPAPAVAIEGVLESLFGLKASIEQFLPTWVDFARDECNELGGLNAALGRDLHLGDSTYLLQARIRVHLEPIPWLEFRDLLPGSSGYLAIVNVIQLAVGPETDFDLEVSVDPADPTVPEFRLGGDDPNRRLGQSTWLRTPASGVAPEPAHFHSTVATESAYRLVGGTQ